MIEIVAEASFTVGLSCSFHQMLCFKGIHKQCCFVLYFSGIFLFLFLFFLLFSFSSFYFVFCGDFGIFILVKILCSVLVPLCFAFCFVLVVVSCCCFLFVLIFGLCFFVCFRFAFCFRFPCFLSCSLLFFPFGQAAACLGVGTGILRPIVIILIIYRYVTVFTWPVG